MSMFCFYLNYKFIDNAFVLGVFSKLQILSKKNSALACLFLVPTL